MVKIEKFAPKAVGFTGIRSIGGSWRGLSGHGRMLPTKLTHTADDLYVVPISIL